MSTNKNIFGRRLSIIRKEKGLTQKQIAEKIGVSWRLISDYERGKARLNDVIIYKIALGLNISSDEILGIKNKNHRYEPSLRIMKRLNKIQKLDTLKQKKILSTLDDLIKANS
jgi:transcriptional regulator with XRE-family HTH domain